MRIVLIFASLVSVRCEFWLQILHTNDLHARFDETDVYSGSCSPQFSRAKKCYGGFARLKTAIDVATEEARSKHIPTINLNVGDTFDGTPSYTTYKWKIVTEFVDRMGFDAMTLGNHEFVDGAEDLASFLKNSRTPVVCSNLNISVDGRFDLPNLRPSLVMNVGNTKIGIVGYLTPHIMHLADHKGLVLPEIPSVRAEARNLKSQGVEIIIALGHSGFHMDKKVAAEVEEISLVVGAHSHTFLYTPVDERPSTEIPLSEYPTMVVQKSGKKVPVVQAYAYSKYLGKLLVRFDDNGNVVEASGNPQLLDGGIEKDPQLDKDISAWMNVIRQRYGAIQGYTRVSLLRPNFLLGRFQSTWGNILTDAILDQAVIDAKRKSLSTWSRSTVVLQPESGIRINIDRDKNDGGVTLEDILIALPFNEELVELAVYGSTIRKLLEYGVSRYDRRKGIYDLSNFLFFSGMQVKYDLSRAHDSRVVSARVLCSDCEVPEFRPLIDNEVYYLITTTYLTHEGSSYVTRTEYINKTILGYKNTDVFIRYLRKNDIVYPKNDERISVVGFHSPFYSASVMTKVSIFILIFSQLIHSIISS